MTDLIPKEAVATQLSKQSTVEGEVTVDGIVHQLLIEAEVGMRKARGDLDHHKKGLDEAQDHLVYWQGRADSLRLLLDRAGLPKTTEANAPTESPALAPVAESEPHEAGGYCGLGDD